MRARRSKFCPRLEIALTALAVCCVLMMPVEYRGGVEMPHAHAVFQFWGSGNVAFDHHGHDHGPAMERASGQALPPLRGVVLGGRLVPLDVSGQPASASAMPPDAPRLSEMTVSAERAVGGAVMVIVAVALLWLTALRRLPIALGRVPMGLTPTPEAPPPRRSDMLAIPVR